MITALDNTEQSINGAKDLSSFMQVQQQGVQVLNDILSEVDAGKFDDIQGQIEDRQQQMQEIFGSLALSANQGVDAEELEGELQQMCAQLPQQQQYYQPQQQQQYYQPQQQMTYGIPQVPQGPINAPQQPAQQQTSDEELEKMMAGI
ncbi:MAG: hypothetical protein EZS28_014381 [Streblomastix strix]|uniref:Uncharacterized protein n=1 Tax=Streblomastix strix TaxID=222440 RepID=A0A5J4W5Q2_9EUKA|nr:MAG: hypothetical protein EZS28_014381 [Streblomastix strix]